MRRISWRADLVSVGGPLTVRTRFPVVIPFWSSGEKAIDFQPHLLKNLCKGDCRTANYLHESNKSETWTAGEKSGPPMKASQLRGEPLDRAIRRRSVYPDRKYHKKPRGHNKRRSGNFNTRFKGLGNESLLIIQFTDDSN